MAAGFTAGPVSTSKAMAGGYGHSMVLKQDGTVWVTGNNKFGQFGDGTTTSRNILKLGPYGTMVLMTRTHGSPNS